MNLLLLVAYCLAGLSREFLVVAYYRKISRSRAYSASGLAGGIELFDFLVLATIIQSGWNPVLLGAYTLGVMLGTYFSIRTFK
jgi:hypothetical protein